MNDLINIATLFIIINKENEIYYNYIRSILLAIKMLSISSELDNNINKKGKECVELSIALMSLTSKMMKERYDEINREIRVE
jgi:hypothetical protein